MKSITEKELIKILDQYEEKYSNTFLCGRDVKKHLLELFGVKK